MVALRWKAMTGAQLHGQAESRMVVLPLYIGYSMHCISNPGMEPCCPLFPVSFAVARASWGLFPLLTCVPGTAL